MTFSAFIDIQTKGFSDVIDITGRVEAIVRSSAMTEGLVCVFVAGSTASVTTIEFEAGAVQDLKDAIERLAPMEIPYRHDTRWGDGNGFSHVRAALMKPGITVPITGGAMTLGTWQQIVVIDFDNRVRQRRIAVQIVGER